MPQFVLQPDNKVGWARLFTLLMLLLSALPHARAEQLPIRAYTTADGLAHDRVARVFCDSRGFLWSARWMG